jgi:hypothetical protein
MKLIIRISLLLTLSALFAAASSAQSLGEAARKARKEKEKSAPSPAQKVYTNENLPSGSLSVASVSGGEKPAAQKSESLPAAGPSQTDQGGTAAASPEGNSSQDNSAWQTKFAEQKNKIELLERELGVLEREYRLRVAVFYADAGTRLRDDRKFADADRQYKADLETKKSALAAAQQQLENMREEARKAGVPAAVRE